ncbi:hypothetical protein [Legionella gresilensis]|uniref:hypothetical protein n=1 Tax=Legionella gresilensis TaxID=91823 RepID=UPI0010411C6A|nr:hypothetical protein [Legionella gresilensis]
MMKKSISVIIFSFLLLFTLGLRLPPKPVTPLTYNNVTYYAAFANKYMYLSPKRGTDYHPTSSPGGYIEAFDSKTNAFLWSVQIYKTIYTDMEEDVQDVYIKYLALQNGKIMITDERNRVYLLDPVSRVVEQIKSEPKIKQPDIFKPGIQSIPAPD